MASDTSSSVPPQDGGITPAKRKRLQQCFEAASKMMAQENCNYDYVTDLLAQCVAGDPGNFAYTQAFLANLKKKYNNNKYGSRGAKFTTVGARSAVKKAMGHKDWNKAIAAGLDALKANPWDAGVLLHMANAAEEAGYMDVQMSYLKAALDGSPKDVDVIRPCAAALAKRKQFDQAIILWHRVEEMRPGDKEAAQAIGDLTVEKTIDKSGLDKKDPSKSKFAKEGQSQLQDATVDVSSIEKLEKTIARKPEELSNYLELAELYIRDEQFGKAEGVLRKACDVSNNDVDIREKWEDAQLRHLRQQLSLAEKEAKTGDEKAKAKFKSLRKEILRKEVDVYRHRCERYPNNLAYKYELGLRYRYGGMYNEAIKEFQQAKNDPRRKGPCLYELARSFEHIQQPKLAMSHYQAAIEEIPDREDLAKKKALYDAGRLAMSLKHLDTADRLLNRLAEMDFNYRDVSALLDQITEMRKNGENLEGGDEPSK